MIIHIEDDLDLDRIAESGRCFRWEKTGEQAEQGRLPRFRCPFCQTHEISWSDDAFRLVRATDIISHGEHAQTAAKCRNRGNIGLAFTYNEPLVGYEYVLDTAKLIEELGMKAVLVTNGTASLSVARKLSPWTDAMNIDLKGFTDRYYRDVLQGNRRDTDVAVIYRLAEVARQRLACATTGNC